MILYARNATKSDIKKHLPSVREHTPHATRTTRTATIVDALKQRALAVLNDTSIDAPTRAIIRCALQTNDPWLAELVLRADANVVSSHMKIRELDTSKTIALLCHDADYTNPPYAPKSWSGLIELQELFKKTAALENICKSQGWQFLLHRQFGILPQITFDPASDAELFWAKNKTLSEKSSAAFR